MSETTTTIHEGERTPKKLTMSRLAYECIKESITLPNTYFSYKAYCNGDYDEDSDYTQQIQSVCGAINLALARLSDSKKVPYKHDKFNYDTDTDTGVLYYTVPENCAKVVNVYRFNYGGKSYTNYAFMKYTNINDRETITLDYPVLGAVYMEYAIEMPYADEETIKYEETTDDAINLRDYGINQSMYTYIKEFVKGQILENIEPEIANEHNARAENYFADLVTYMPQFSQKNVNRSF